MLRAMLFVTALLPLPRALAQSPAREKDGSKLVRATLLADRETIHPGETFQLGVELAIRPGWHVYWENAGDAGKRTEIELTGPDGFTIGAPRFPCPVRRVDEGDIVSFVHEGTILVVLDAKAPEKLEPGTKLAFRVVCDWLVCTDYCLTGGANAEVELVAAAAGTPVKLANAKRFDEGRAKLPRPASEVLDAKHAPRVEAKEGGAYDVVIDVPGATELEFFPLDQDGAAFVKSESSRTQDGARIVLHYDARRATKTDAKDEHPCPGVLRIETTKGETSCFTHATPPSAR